MLKIAYLILFGILFPSIESSFPQKNDAEMSTFNVTDENFTCCSVNLDLFNIFGNLCTDDEVEFGFKLGSSACEALHVIWDESDGSEVISERKVRGGYSLRVRIPFKCQNGVYHIDAAGSVLVQAGSCLEWVSFSGSFDLGTCC